MFGLLLDTRWPDLTCTWHTEYYVSFCFFTNIYFCASALTFNTGNVLLAIMECNKWAPKPDQQTMHKALNVNRNMEKMFLLRLEGSRGGMWGEACINTHSSLSFYLSSLLTHFFLLLPTYRHANTHTQKTPLHTYACSDSEEETCKNEWNLYIYIHAGLDSFADKHTSK